MTDRCTQSPFRDLVTRCLIHLQSVAADSNVHLRKQAEKQNNLFKYKQSINITPHLRQGSYVSVSVSLSICIKNL